MKLKYVPQVRLNGSKSKRAFSGYLEVEVPNYLDRLKLKREVKANLKEDLGDDDDFDWELYGYEMVKKCVSEISLKHGSTEITSLEELSFYKEGGLLLAEVVTLITNGPSLGNTLGQRSSNKSDGTFEA